jgi:fructose-1,6-bisphosphatase/sedoheptulose 1,7-bisphosphatase-like protein
MKGQVHNQGELKELKVDIEKPLVEAIEQMADNTGYSLNELVAIALKRFRASHSDYEKKTMSLD